MKLPPLNGWTKWILAAVATLGFSITAWTRISDEVVFRNNLKQDHDNQAKQDQRIEALENNYSDIKKAIDSLSRVQCWQLRQESARYGEPTLLPPPCDKP